MNNYLSPGDSVTITAGGTIASGAVVQQGQLLGIAAHDATVGQPLTIKTQGVFRVTKVGSQAWTEGALVYWNGTAFTTATGGNPFLAGCAVEAVSDALGATTGVIRLNGTAQPNI